MHCKDNKRSVFFLLSQYSIAYKMMRVNNLFTSLAIFKYEETSLNDGTSG